MGIFDTIKEKDGIIIQDEWIAWVHEGYKEYMVDYAKPASKYAQVLKNILDIAISLFSKCCGVCIALNSCHFVKWKMPKQPLHEKCHCSTIKAPTKTAKANCPIEKFTQYIFTNTLKSRGKIEIFESMGYNINDSEFLKIEFEKQAAEKYLAGDYTLDALSTYGQAINIIINLQAGNVLTGWQVRPNGTITNNTPFAGQI